MKDNGRRQALETTLNSIQKRYGEGAIMRLGQAGHLQIDVIPTGSLVLDLALGDPNDDGRALRAGLPVYEVRSWLTGNRLVAAPFATLCDPLVSGPEDLGLLLDKVMQTARDRRSKHVEISRQIEQTATLVETRAA